MCKLNLRSSDISALVKQSYLLGMEMYHRLGLKSYPKQFIFGEQAKMSPIQNNLKNAKSSRFCQF